MRVGIVGGGPGGLITAYFLEKRSPVGLQIKIFEQSDRIGGKILTRRFDRAPVPYEAGAAEIYGYAQTKPDPLHNLIRELGLGTIDMAGQAVVLDGHILASPEEIERHLGRKALHEIRRFHAETRRHISPIQYYNSGWPDENEHPLAGKSFQSLIERVRSRQARRYLKVAVHSDLATEPPRTSALFGAHNVLMEHPDYVRLYGIEGGMERLPEALSRAISAELATGCRATMVRKGEDGKYRVGWECAGGSGVDDFDALVVALPNCWLPAIEWGGRRLDRVMAEHNLYYDGAAHYLRICLLFREPFWRAAIPGSFFQLDRFGGCCVYDEGSRLELGGHGVLSWLLAGSEALLRSNLVDDELVRQALASLPQALAFGRELLIEGKVHRWVGAVGAPRVEHRIKGARARHLPDAKEHPGLFVVGDYLFDDTINGVLDSADIASRMVLRQLRVPARPFTLLKPRAEQEASSQLKKSYFKYYDGKKGYDRAFEEYFDHEVIVKSIKAVWGAEPPYRLLDSGSANGLSIRAFAKSGVEAWGIENNAYIHKRTPAKLRPRNIFGDVRNMPFDDGLFDFVYDTTLCYVPEASVDRAIQELRRVARRGVIFGAITSDISAAVAADEADVADGVQIWNSLPQWAERFLRNGFRLAILDGETLRKVRKLERRSNGGESWYADRDALRYAFFTKEPAIDRFESEDVRARVRALGGGALALTEAAE